MALNLIDVEMPALIKDRGAEGVALWERAIDYDDEEAAFEVALTMNGHNGERADYGFFLIQNGAESAGRRALLDAWTHDHGNFYHHPDALTDFLLVLDGSGWGCESLPDQVEVWRGQAEGEEEAGVSWSLKRETAEWFITTWGRGLHARGVDGVLLRRVVPRSKILAYLNGRNEDEVLLWPVDLSPEWIVTRLPALGVNLPAGATTSAGAPGPRPGP